MIRTRFHDIELAYKFYTSISPRGFSKTDFRRVMKRVTTCDLTEGQVDVIFALFDSDGNGTLQAEEFCDVLRVGFYICKY